MTRITIILIAGLLIFKNTVAQSTFSIMSTWKVDAAKTFADLKGDKKSRYQNMQLQKQQHIYRLFENRTFRFYNDSLVQVRFQDGSIKEINGKFLYDAVNSRLSINVNGIITLYKVNREAQNKLRLVFLTPSPQGLLNSLYLVQKN